MNKRPLGLIHQVSKKIQENKIIEPHLKFAVDLLNI
jgi:hypothetical protein